MAQTQINAASNPMGGIFDQKIERERRWLTWLWLGALFLAGIAFWYWFLQEGRIKFNYQDWLGITSVRLQFLKDALMHGQLPLHIASGIDLKGGTDRYMSVPDAFLAPQALLLLVLDISKFVLVNQILMFALGFAGLLWFRKRFSLSLFAFTILFLLFNFNGHLLSHASVGHETWGGYFLFPWFAALIFMLIDGDHSWGWVAKMALLLFFMYLNGSFHQFVWSLLFLLIFAAASWKNALPALKAVFFALLLGLVRILPPVLMVGDYVRLTTFFGGYPSLLTLLNGLVGVELPTREVPVPFSTYVLGWWEYSLYIGLVGALFLAVFGVIRWLRRRPDGAGHYELLIPSLALVIFSIGQDYGVIRVFKIPLFDGELVATRIISLPFVFLIILAVVEFQRWMESKPLTAVFNAGMAGVAVLGVRDLWEYARTWRLDTASTFFPQQLPALQRFTAANHPDETYIRLLILGAAGSLAGLAALAVLAWLEKRGSLGRAAARLRSAAFSDPSRRPAGFGERARLFLAEIIAPAVRRTADAEMAPIQNRS